MYAPYFNRETNDWKVVTKDDDGYWFDYVVGIDSEKTAKDIAKAMNDQNKPDAVDFAAL